MAADELQNRTKAFALRIMKLSNSLTTNVAARELARQLVRSAMSVSANYRAARRARSRREFLAKIGIVAEEADETQHWLELISESKMIPVQRLTAIIREAGELVAIFSSTQKTVRMGGSRPKTIASPNGKLPNYQIARLPD